MRIEVVVTLGVGVDDIVGVTLHVGVIDAVGVTEGEANWGLMLLV